MQLSTFTLTAILAALAQAAPTPSLDVSVELPAGVTQEAPAPNVAVGSAIVNNNCGFPVHLRSVGGSANPEHILQHGGTFIERFRVSSIGAGVSIKMAKNGDPATSKNISQFEYTLAGSKVYYDLSHIDGNPFKAHYHEIIPGIHSCDKVVCEANESPCEAAYSDPPQLKTHGCASHGNLVHNICQ